MICPFSENWPANYNFSLLSKLPTNYPSPPQKKINKSKSNLFSEITGETPYFRLFFFEGGYLEKNQVLKLHLWMTTPMRRANPPSRNHPLPPQLE